MKLRLTGVLLLILQISISAQDRLSGKSFATRSEVIAQNGMVATNHPLASQIGVDILKQGGSAIDAAIAANAFLGLSDPGNNGMGGDLFAIVWDAKTEKLYGLNASGKSPELLTVKKLREELDKGRSHRSGPLSVTTPGCVDGWVSLHERFGKLPFRDILQPTIEYAREGFPITEEVGTNLRNFEGGIIRSNNEIFKETYFIDGHFPRKGDVFRNPQLANSLEIVAREGRKGFYEGSIAEKIEKHLKERGGYLKRSDLVKNKPVWVDPVSINYRGYDVWEIPPNGQGIAALQMLNILKQFDIGSMSFGSADHIHYYLEAKKLAYEDLAKYYGDPEFGKIPLEELLSDEYAKKRSELIDQDRAGVYDPGLFTGDHTIYLTAADKDGNMISLIQSNSGYFGSLEIPEDLGFVLQNRGAGFILEEGHINMYAPNKRPFHTIIPAFVTKDGKPFMSFGVMGGDMQPQGHTQVLMNIIDFGMNLQEAGDAPRIRHFGTSSSQGHSNSVGDTYLEWGFDFETVRELIYRGHRIRTRVGAFGGYQGIMLKNGVYYGASESRKDGQAAGY